MKEKNKEESKENKEGNGAEIESAKLIKDDLHPQKDYLTHFLKYYKYYLLVLAILILSIPFLANFFQDKPLLSGIESYYHLSQAAEIRAQNFYYAPIYLLLKTIPESLLFLIPFGLALISVVLALIVIQKLKRTREFSFFFLLFLIITPAFIYTFTTFSAYSIFLALLLFGFLLLLQKNITVRYLSIIPFAFTVFQDLFCGIFTLALLSAYFYRYRDERTVRKIYYFAVSLIIILIVLGKYLLKIPFLLGPFYPESAINDLISDLGGVSGISLFLLILAVIGIITSLKKKEFYAFYITLLISLAAFIYNSQAIFFLALVTAWLAAEGLLNLLQYKWSFIQLRKFTILLIALCLLFSTLTYLDRYASMAPAEDDLAVLSWVRENTHSDAIIFSTPENSQFIQHFARRKAFFTPFSAALSKEEQDSKQQSAATILESTYLSTTLPILEENHISLIYVTPRMKQSYPAEEGGLLFLLKNERFKLIYSSGNYEVWYLDSEPALV